MYKTDSRKTSYINNVIGMLKISLTFLPRRKKGNYNTEDRKKRSSHNKPQIVQQL